MNWDTKPPKITFKSTNYLSSALTVKSIRKFNQTEKNELASTLDDKFWPYCGI